MNGSQLRHHECNWPSAVSTFPTYQPKEGFIYYVSWQLNTNYCLSKSVSNQSGLVEKCINFIRSELVHEECTQVSSFDVTFNQDTYITVSIQVPRTHKPLLHRCTYILLGAQEVQNWECYKTPITQTETIQQHY